MDWKDRPTSIEYCPDDVELIMGLDENGTANHKGVRKRIEQGKPIDDNDRFFTLTGTLLNTGNYLTLAERMNIIKYRYWKDGLYLYKNTHKRVCFHSREIRRRDAPFNLDPLFYDAFINDITNLIDELPFDIFSCVINKEALCRRYVNPYYPYHLAAEFIIERFCMSLNRLQKNGIIILESRGFKEDKFVLKRLIDILEKGNRFHGGDHFERMKGIYFNPKWSKRMSEKGTYVVLELADLVSFPIHKFVKNTFQSKDLAFEVVEGKLSNYPNYFGRGLKVFP